MHWLAKKHMALRYRIQLPSKMGTHPYTGKETWPPIEPSQATVDLCKQWCKTCVGANGWNYYGMYRKVPFEFRFKREEDLLAFKLRFGLTCQNQP